MANTDNTQAKITTDNSNPADSFVTSATTTLTNESNAIESKVIQTDVPLMRYDESNYSYVLGYN